MEKKELIQSIKNYNPFCEHITLSTIFAKMKLADEEKFNVINYGPPGTGKSYSSLHLLQELETGTDIILDNNTTKRGLFETFLNYPNHDIILDECSSIVRDKGAQDMIKLAQEGKPLNWVKSSSIETTPPYKGNIILNTNHAVLDSLLDRCFVNQVLMNKKMALDFVELYMDKQEKDKLFISYLKKVLSRNLKGNLTNDDMEYVKKFVQDKINMNEENLGYSRRVVIRMLSYFKRVKLLFNCLDDEIKEFIEPYASIYIENKRTPTIIETLLGDEKMDKIALIKLLASQTTYSERHARRLIDDELVKGRLHQFGRLVYVK